MGYLVAKSLTHQLQLTNTTQCAISLKEYASGDCLPWINADGWLLFVSFGAYQRICRRVRDPSHDELEGAVRLRVCLEMLWVGLLQTRTSIDDSIKLFRDFDCVSPACRMFIRDRFRQACLIASGGAGQSGPVNSSQALPPSRNAHAFLEFARSIETSRRDCIRAWRDTIRTRTGLYRRSSGVTGSPDLRKKRKRDEDAVEDHSKEPTDSRKRPRVL